MGSRVIENNPCFAGNVPNVKSILHQKKDINVLWTQLVGNKGSKNDEASYFPVSFVSK
jgi:hypothetical protein